MSIAADLDAFEALAKALGILSENGSPNEAWFADPIGQSSNPRGLQDILSTDSQRDALLTFVDDVLGAPDRAERDGATWVPLFSESAPNVAIFAVVKPVSGAVHLGIGFEHMMGGSAPSVATRVHVPIFRAERGDAALTSLGDIPPWLLLGRPEGRIEITLALSLSTAAPVPGVASLGGLDVQLGIPSDGSANARLALALRDLQLPGASAPRSMTLDATTAGALGAEVLELLATLVRAQVDALAAATPLPTEVSGLLGLLGLREVPGLLPLPLAEIPTRGIDALVQWLRAVLENTASRSAWLTQIRQVIGGSIDAGAQSVTTTNGALSFTVGVKTSTGSGGAFTVVPFASIALNTTPGASVRIAVDLLRADLATGAVLAIPDLRAEALFGNQAGGGALLTGTTAVGGLRTGLVLKADRRPAFSLTLHDVTVVGVVHEVLDLSSPDAAVSAADAVIGGALDAAMTQFGAAGDLIGRVLGIRPPAGVTAVSANALLANPLNEVTRYWRDLTASAPAMADVLGALRALIAQVPQASVPGAGTKDDPWRVELLAPLVLLAWRDGDALVIDAALDIVVPVLTGHSVTTTLRASLLRLGFTPAQVTFVGAASASVTLTNDAGPLELDLANIILTADALRARVSWSPARGLLLDLEAPASRAIISVPDIETEIALPIPVRGADGKLTIPNDLLVDVQELVTALAVQAEVPIIDELLLLIGWTGEGAELSLAALVEGDAELAIRTWLADLLLDCNRVRAVMGVVARLLSGGLLREPLGSGGARSPYRCPIAGEPRAPALVAWLIPPCPPRSDPGKLTPPQWSTDVPEDGESLAARLLRVSPQLPALRDLLVNRDSLASGFEQLITRWTDTDGVLPVPLSLPTGVTLVRRGDTSYDDLVAEGACGLLTTRLFPTAPATVVHVGCEAIWRTDRPAGFSVDASGAADVGSLSATGTGEWFICLPTVAAARAVRADRDAVAEQADRLTRVFAQRTAPVTVIAYGAAAAAVIRSALTRTMISEVVTVGAPWSALSVTAFRTGLGADALRVLERLLRTDAPSLVPLQRALAAPRLDVMRDVVNRALEVARDDTSLPNAGAEERRAGLACRAVFGALSEDRVRSGLGELLDDGISARFETQEEAEETPVERSALHMGVDVPVLAATIGGVRVGIGATFDLAAVERDAVKGVKVSTLRGATVHVELGLVDGWLVGGPSPEPSDVNVRWMSAHVTVPFDGSAGDTEFVLYEAMGLGAYRERWVVRADADNLTATQALPEVRAMLSAVITRLTEASPDLLALLDIIGLVRDGGLEAAGLDRLLFEPQLVAAQVRVRGLELATTLRRLVSDMAGSASTMTWSVGSATLSLDAVDRTFGVNIADALGDVTPCTITASLGTGGLANFEVSIGALDANAGGVRLVGRAGGVTGLAVEWKGAGAAPTRTVSLLPVPDVAGLTSFAATLAPAFLMQGLARALRDRANAAGAAAMDAALDAMSLLRAADEQGHRAIRLPLALFDDVSGWLRHGAESWRTDAVGSMVRLLDAVAPLVAPARGAAAGWPIIPGVDVRYSGAGGRLSFTLDATLTSTVGTASVATRINAGLRISGDGRVEPSLETSVIVDGAGLQLSVTPSVQLSLVRRPPASLLTLYPAGAGLGGVLSAVGETVLPPVLNAIAARRSDAAASLIKNVGRAVFELGTALELHDGANFTAARITSFAEDPASRLLGRLPALVSTGMAQVAAALDPLASRVRVVGPNAGRLTLQFGSAQQILLTLDTSGASPVLRFSGTLALAAVGNIVIEELRLAADGVGIAVRIGPAPLLIGGVTLRPMLSVRAGVTASGVSRLAAIGLSMNETGTKSVDVRWALNGTAPSLAIVTRGASESLETNAERIALALLGVAASVASGIALPVLRPSLPPRAITGLTGVLFNVSGANVVLDPTFLTDLLEPERLFTRLKRLAWNLATLSPPLSVTIQGVVKISLAAEGSGATKRLGVTLTLVGADKRLELVSGNPNVAIELLDADWITGAPVAPGLTITVLNGQVTAAGDVQLEIDAGFTIAGIALTFSKGAGPLIELGPVSLDGIAVHMFGEISSSGIGAGVQLELTGLAIAPAGAGGNPVAGGILGDAARGGANNRPAFSPGVAVAARAGGSADVSVRAGAPPGPWWLVIQRELGPLYLERIGFDSRSANGSITRLQLLFDGRVSIFGMTAAVDQLSLTWTGGDLFSASRWQADLMGLAVSADLSGITIAGGLLKDTSGGYVGMLLGRFGTYGITLYGGYAVINGNASFFIFGAVNGPIGGPPAFFLTGIGAGLGINRQLRVPTDLSQFGEYPFIKALDIAASVSDPMVELRKLNEYFKPQPGQFWVAAGISFTSFALVDGIAVVAVSFGANGLDINLLGLARMALPRPQVALVSIELGLLARFSVSEGIFSIRAQLTENSWLLYPEIRLTGGFAFVVWWKGPLKGQFVLTIGGYHPRFHRDGYPDVPRLGLYWQVSDDIVVKGGAYFALTSEALMAGIDVTVSADYGWAWARITFAANGIVFFDPFWFEVEARATISAGVKIKTWLGTVRFSLSTTSGLKVHGPEFGGKASFNVGPCSVSVPFGSSTKRQGDLLDWPAFVAKYLEIGSGGGARALSAITGLGTLTKKASAGKAESADGSAARPFEVFGEFQIAIASSVPITVAQLGAPSASVGVTPVRPDNQATTLGIAPVGSGNMASTLTLTIVGTSSEPGVAGAKPGVLESQVNRVGLDLEAFPKGVWGEPTSGNDAIPKGDVVFALNRLRFDLRREVGASLIPPIPYRRVTADRAPLPLQATGGERTTMFNTADDVQLPAPTTTGESLTDARKELFALRKDALPAGVLASGKRGAVAEAAFLGDRVAPPLFGTLADGLRRTNPPDAKAATPPSAATAAPAGARRPRVTGVLGGGAGVIDRGVKTSVANAKLKRRPAPSIDSVRSRLTRELPVKLTQSPRPGTPADRTLLATGVAPFTAAPGTSRSVAVGRTSSGNALDNLVKGLSVAAQNGNTTTDTKMLHAGDLVVLHADDASIDLDALRRPKCTVTGQARITMAANDGTVLADATVTKALVVPTRTALIVMQAGGDTGVRDGMAGWHDRSRVARIDRRVAVGPGCTLQLEGIVIDAPPAWVDAGALVEEATAVTTRFTDAVRTIAIVLAGTNQPSPTDVSIDLDGATRVTEKEGKVRAPRVVMAGSRAVMLFDVAPIANEAVSVRVVPGGPWQLHGVLGGSVASEQVVRTIATQGVEAIAGRLLLAADGKPISVAWVPPPKTAPAAPRAVAKSTKKSAARKSSARKSPAKSRRRGKKNG